MNAPDLITIGRVGKSHGLDGSFVVEDASEVAGRFDAGTELFVDGQPMRIVGSKRARGRPVIRLEQRPARGTALQVERASLEPTREGEYYVFELVGLPVEEEGGRLLGTVTDVAPGVANDVLELDSGLLLPLVEDCVRTVDLENRIIVVASGFNIVDPH